jgi:hypothetical protein
MIRAVNVIGIAASVAIVLGGCSKPEAAKGAVDAPAAEVVAQADAPPACKDVFQPGQLVDKAKAQAGCSSPSGTPLMMGSVNCKDGTLLWEVDGPSGAPAGYFREGQPYQTVQGEVTADAGYKKAYEACVG